MYLPNRDQIGKLGSFKNMLEHIMRFLMMNKHEIQLSHKNRLCQVEKQIVNFITSHRQSQPKLPQPSLQSTNKMTNSQPNSIQFNSSNSNVVVQQSEHPQQIEQHMLQNQQFLHTQPAQDMSNVSNAIVPDKSSVEQPCERLIRNEQQMSQNQQFLQTQPAQDKSNVSNVVVPDKSSVEQPCERLISNEQQMSQNQQLLHTQPAQDKSNVSNVVVPDKSSDEQPFERLIRAVKNSSPEALRSLVSDMHQTLSMSNGIGVGEDLYFPMMNSRPGRTFVARARPSDEESTATSIAKRAKLDAYHAKFGIARIESFWVHFLSSPAFRVEICFILHTTVETNTLI